MDNWMGSKMCFSKSYKTNWLNQENVVKFMKRFKHSIKSIEFLIKFNLTCHFENICMKSGKNKFGDKHLLIKSY